MITVAVILIVQITASHAAVEQRAFLAVLSGTPMGVGASRGSHLFLGPSQETLLFLAVLVFDLVFVVAVVPIADRLGSLGVGIEDGTKQGLGPAESVPSTTGARPGAGSQLVPGGHGPSERPRRSDGIVRLRPCGDSGFGKSLFVVHLGGLIVLPGIHLGISERFLLALFGGKAVGIGKSRQAMAGDGRQSPRAAAAGGTLGGRPFLFLGLFGSFSSIERRSQPLFGGGLGGFFGLFLSRGRRLSRSDSGRLKSILGLFLVLFGGCRLGRFGGFGGFGPSGRLLVAFQFLLPSGGRLGYSDGLFARALGRSRTIRRMDFLEILEHFARFAASLLFLGLLAVDGSLAVEGGVQRPRGVKIGGPVHGSHHL